MKHILTLALALAFGASAANAATYQIDEHHANARFAIRHFGTSTNIGGFFGLKGEIQWDAKKGTGKVDVVIPMTQLNSGVEAFDHHLKSADIFNAEKYPEMRFVSTKFIAKDGKVEKVEGKLTMTGQTHPVTLNALNFNCYNSAMFENKEVCGGDFETVIDRTKWGVNYLSGKGVPDEAKITIQIEAVKK